LKEKILIRPKKEINRFAKNNYLKKVNADADLNDGEKDIMRELVDYGY
jgi:hypothetical protein